MSTRLAIKTSAPGSLMLLGEYAVLHGHHALVAAIDKRMYVTLHPRDDERIIINSTLGHYETTIPVGADPCVRPAASTIKPFEFVIAALTAFQKNLTHGCTLTIESEFSAAVGFASSAAVTVATLYALSHWLKIPLLPLELIQLARQTIRTAQQGVGSGADVAACVLGGAVLYRAEPMLATKLPFLCPLTVVYSGSKTPTPIAISQVSQKFADAPDDFLKICQAINACTLQGVTAWQQQNWAQLGKTMNTQQECMNALGVNTAILNDIILQLHEQPTIQGAKISGAGLGDCAIGVGECRFEAKEPIQQIQVNLSDEGVRCEKA